MFGVVLSIMVGPSNNMGLIDTFLLQAIFPEETSYISALSSLSASKESKGQAKEAVRIVRVMI